MFESNHDGVSPAALVVSIVPQGRGTQIIQAAKEAHATGGFIIFGHGTASKEIWERLGITKDREIILCATLYSRVDAVMKAITENSDMKKAGGGIVFSVSIDRILGSGLIKHILQKARDAGINIPDSEREKVEEMKQRVENLMNQSHEEKKKAQEGCPMELVVVRMANGYGQEVMDCARKVGAGGGTVLHGRTSLDSPAVKFFNITIEPESDILFMLVSKEITEAVLKAISKDWGPHTAAHAFGFVIPVLKVFAG